MTGLVLSDRSTPGPRIDIFRYTLKTLKNSGLVSNQTGFSSVQRHTDRHLARPETEKKKRDNEFVSGKAGSPDCTQPKMKSNQTQWFGEFTTYYYIQTRSAQRGKANQSVQWAIKMNERCFANCQTRSSHRPRTPSIRLASTSV